jgi:hypothetical protein
MLRDDRAGLRAADADREATADLLRRAHGEGRIDTTELEQRLHDCYAAKTYADLDALASDLPRPVERGREPGARRRRPRLVPIAVIAVALALGVHAIWVVWLLLFFAFMRFGPTGRGVGHRAGRCSPRDRYV